MNWLPERPWPLLLLAALLVAVVLWLLWIRPRRPAGGAIEAEPDLRARAMGLDDNNLQTTAPMAPVDVAPTTARVKTPAGPALASVAFEAASTSSPVEVPVKVPAAPRAQAPAGLAGLAGLAETELAEPAADDPALAEEVGTAPHSAMQGLTGIAGEFTVSVASVGSPHGPDSVLPNPDGSAPMTGFPIKGNAASKLYHTAASPYFARTRADVWFRSEVDARRAGFAAWNRKAKQAAAAPQPDFEDGAYPGSAQPRPDGSAPTEEFTIKCDEGSKLYHAPHSQHYRTASADVWFRSEADARRAGFTPSNTSP